MNGRAAIQRLNCSTQGSADGCSTFPEFSRRATGHASPLLPEAVTPNLAIELLTLGVILTAAFLGLVTSYPEIGRITLVVTAVGGGLCLYSGWKGLTKRGGTALAKLTMGAIVPFAAVRAFIAWIDLPKGEISLMEPLLCSLVFGFSLGITLMVWKEAK